jgi:hypothetical protein
VSWILEKGMNPLVVEPAALLDFKMAELAKSLWPQKGVLQTQQSGQLLPHPLGFWFSPT